MCSGHIYQDTHVFRTHLSGHSCVQDTSIRTLMSSGHIYQDTHEFRTPLIPAYVVLPAYRPAPDWNTTSASCKKAAMET